MVGNSKSVFVCQSLNHGRGWKANVPGRVQVMPFLAKDTGLQRVYLRHQKIERSTRPQKPLYMHESRVQIRQMFEHEMHGHHINRSFMLAQQCFNTTVNLQLQSPAQFFSKRHRRLIPDQTQTSFALGREIAPVAASVIKQGSPRRIGVCVPIMRISNSSKHSVQERLRRMDWIFVVKRRDVSRAREIAGPDHNSDSGSSPHDPAFQCSNLDSLCKPARPERCGRPSSGMRQHSSNLQQINPFFINSPSGTRSYIQSSQQRATSHTAKKRNFGRRAKPLATGSSQSRTSSVRMHNGLNLSTSTAMMRKQNHT